MSLSDESLSRVSWSAAASLLGVAVFAHLGVLAAFVLDTSVSPLLAPAAFLLALLIGDLLARREDLPGRLRAVAGAIAVAVAFLGMGLAATFLDLSWDGLWYHQTAIYQMAEGWNPIRDPLRAFEPHLQDWIRHYAKGPWYLALALYQTTGEIEWAKMAPWLAAAAMVLCVCACGLDLGLRRGKAGYLAMLVCLNPVVVCELATYLVDGLLISYMACAIAATLRYLRRPSVSMVCIVALATVLCINTKFTGLVYLCFFVAAGGLYCLLKHRHRLTRYVALQATALLLGTMVFGFNPYVTNFVHRGNPFYPVLGSQEHPSLRAGGEDPIERWETPHNMLGRSRLVRLGFATFGRPGAQPSHPGENAELMWPLAVERQDFAMFYFHDVRIGGFGPFFSFALLLGGILLGLSVFRTPHLRVPLILSSLAIVGSLLVSPHTWWPRYGPQLWWLPILGAIGALSDPASQTLRWLGRVLLALLLVNAVAIAIVHFRWEVGISRASRSQMAHLRTAGGIEVDFQYFGEPYGKRLQAAGVTFRTATQLGCPDPIELVSVPHGYPGAVRACLPESVANTPNGPKTP